MTHQFARRGRRQPKTEAACAQLLKMAQSAGPGTQLPTFLELCSSLRVSKGTLDSALREMENQQILERRHGVGIFVCAGVCKPVLMLIRDCYADKNNPDPFWSLLTQQVHQWARMQNYEVTAYPINNYNPDMSGCPELETLLQSKHWHGVLAFGIDVQISEWIVNRGISLVAFAGYAMYMVSIDSSYALRGGVWHLKELGCRNIGLWNHCNSTELDVAGHEPTTTHQFRQALEGNSILFHSSLVKTFTEQDWEEQTIEAVGYQAIHDIFRSSNIKPDGIVVVHDHLTRGAIRALKELGLQVGEDVKIVTSANRGSDLLCGYEECLILMEFDALQIVQEMFEILEAHGQGEIPGGSHRFVRPVVKTPVRKEVLS